MRKIWLLGLSICLVAMVTVVQGCEQAKEPVVETCDTKPRTYTGDVKAIIDLYCKVCHQPGGSYPSIPLTNYAEVKNATQNGKLLGSIKHDGSAVPMPQGGAKISDSDIAIIDCWVSKNYPE